MRCGGRWLCVAFLAWLLAVGGVETARAEPDVISHDNCVKDSPRAVIFIHGFKGNATTAFRSRGRPSWQEIFCADDQTAVQPRLNTYDVYSFDWSSFFKKDVSLGKIADEISSKLQTKFFGKYETVHLVGHSAGGILIQDLLIHLRGGNRNDLLDKIGSVFLIATPSQGAKSAKDFKPFFDYFDIPGEHQIPELQIKQFNPFLRELNRHWSAYFDHRTGKAPIPVVFCAYESEAELNLFKIVPDLYATQLCHGKRRGFQGTHRSVVKPKSRTDAVYEWVAAGLADASKKATEHLAELKLARDALLVDSKTGLTRHGFCPALKERYDRIEKVIINRPFVLDEGIAPESEWINATKELVFLLEAKNLRFRIGGKQQVMNFFGCPERKLTKSEDHGDGKVVKALLDRKVLLDTWPVFWKDMDAGGDGNFMSAAQHVIIPVRHKDIKGNPPTDESGRAYDGRFLIPFSYRRETRFAPYLDNESGFDVVIAMALGAWYMREGDNYVSALRNFCDARDTLVDILKKPENLKDGRASAFDDLFSLANIMVDKSFLHTLADDGSLMNSVLSVGDPGLLGEPCKLISEQPG